MSAQEQMPLMDLGEFKTPTNNWQIVGQVTMDRNVNFLKSKEQPVKSSIRRKKRKKKDKYQPSAVSFEPGTGILLGRSDRTGNNLLETSWKHGDIELEFEVMVSKNSAFKIYFQGKYGLQLSDSWGIRLPTAQDMGGINYLCKTNDSNEERNIVPMSNPSKAPGLWQKLKISFQSPKFDKSGKKIANAKFVSISLNGMVVQSNVELSNCGDTSVSDEFPEGPLVIHGYQGAIAFRNIQYRLLEQSKVELKSLSYKVYKGKLDWDQDLNHEQLESEGVSKQLDINSLGLEDSYGIVYSGNLNVPKKDVYTLYLGYTGGVSLSIGGKKVIYENTWDGSGERIETVELDAGDYSFSLTNLKSAAWYPPRLGLSIAGKSTHPKTFNTYESYPPEASSTEPVFVKIGQKPQMLRGFVSFNGNEDKLSHTIGVGTPEGINFIFNLNSGNLIGVWRGEFADTTPMWTHRGDGSFEPKGAVQWTFLNQPIAQLPSMESAFPGAKAPFSDFVYKGYSIHDSGLPIFKHRYKGIEIENFISPDSSNTYLIQEIRFSQSNLKDFYLKLASGKVRSLPDGSFAIGGQQYYIKMKSDQKPFIREVNGETELIVLVDGKNIEYEIIW